MQRLRLARVLTVLVPGAGVAETVVTMPPVGFRYATQIDAEFTSTSGNHTKTHSVLRREVFARLWTTIRTHDAGTVSGSGVETTVSGKSAYRLFL